VYDVLGIYLVKCRCVGESSYVFKPIARISKVKGCNSSDSLLVKSDLCGLPLCS